MFSKIVQSYMGPQARSVERSLSNPEQAQTQTLIRLKAARSLSELKSLPASNSKTLSADLNAAFQSGFWRGERVQSFGRTSGSAGEPKIIPLTKSYFHSLDRTLFRMIACLLASTGEWQRSLLGKRILLGSRPVVDTSPTGLSVLDISGHVMTRSSLLSRWLYLPGKKDFYIADWDAKVERILSLARHKSVVSISGIPALVLDFTQKALAKYGVKYLEEIWPELSLLVYGGVPLTCEIKNRISGLWYNSNRELISLETWFATEAALGFSLDPRKPGLALNLLENAYLFISEDGSHKLAHELEVGRVYSVLVTTPGGLINYSMGDRIRVLSTRPLLVQVTGRDFDELSMTGEKITLEQIDMALSRLGLPSSCVWTEAVEKPHLVWAIPLERTGLTEELGKKLDQCLCELNPLYAEAMIQEKVIGKSKMRSLPEDFWFRDSVRKPKRIFKSQEEFLGFYFWLKSI